MRTGLSLSALGVSILAACASDTAPVTDAANTNDTDAANTNDTDAANTNDTDAADTIVDTGAVADGDTALGDERDARQYCELTVDLFCPYYLRCGRIVASDLDDCRQTFLETCNGRYEPLYAALADRGLLALSAAGIARCKTHLEAVSCEQQIFDLDGGCDAVWVGQVEGGGCGPGIESFVCDAASTCVLGLSFCGECKPLATGACDLEHRCPDDGTCRDGVCVPRAQVGERCDAATSCVLGADCRDGRCAAPTIVAVGDTCDQRRRCPYRASCVSGRCVEAALLGESCDASVTCASGWCSEGVCVRLLDGGATCSASSSCVSGRCSNGSCLGAGESACLP